MADLSHLDEQLAEVLGLAQAAQAATKKVATLANKETQTDVVKFALPLQQSHVAAIREHSRRLAAEEDPSETA